MSYTGYLKATNTIKKFPYVVRWCFWTMLYFYNRRKYPLGDFTLRLYWSYAKSLKSHQEPVI